MRTMIVHHELLVSPPDGGLVCGPLDASSGAAPPTSGAGQPWVPTSAAWVVGAEGTERRTEGASPAPLRPPPTSRLERRQRGRVAVPWPLQLTPVDDRGEVCGPETVVLGRYLSSRGLDFYCQDPLPYRRVLVRIPNAEQLGLVPDIPLRLQLRWCRFAQQGWYEHGGQFG